MPKGVYPRTKEMKTGKHMKGRILSIETRNKIGLSHTGQHYHLGQKAWNKGKKCPTISKARIGIKFSNEHRKNLSLSHIGKIPSNKGKKRPEITGEKHPNWQGGKSFEEYGKEFDNQLKEIIRYRDNYNCSLCNNPQVINSRQLDVHHIDYNKKNNYINNLISLCSSCHRKTNYNREYWKGYFECLKKK